ncbi:MAG: transporter [Ferruginibacter sp.]|uniref:ion channel n=1 Tax=Ferruginibacter sp. TaxID=1940288 RepID=UPI00265A1DDF|nr:ion channel [Ferruginibacter sp.]MDB5279838.1 transporter [Ferruginibacter sp.]
MAAYKNINPFSKKNNDTGFASNSNDTGGRFINKDGSYNLIKEGMPFHKRFSIFNDMLNLPLWKFISVIFIFFLLINCLFTALYLLIGYEQLDGLIRGSNWKIFREIFYFSTQTFTTVGYGHVNPAGDGANMVAGIEALTGFLSLAIATGLIYGRFSRPRSYLIFSDNALVSPYKDGKALMFRFAAFKDKHALTDVEIRVNAGLLVAEEGKADYKYFSLNLERNRVESMPMSWTVVHPIDENSPLHGFTEEDMKTADLELYVMLRGFDDVFSNYVQQRTSYTFSEIHHNRKFAPMYRESEDGKTTILELHKINVHHAVDN